LEKNVVEKDHDENILKQNLIWAKSLTWVLIGTTLSFIGWLSIAKTDEILVVQGKLEPIGKVKEIQIPIGGVARELLVEGGDLVKKGQVLIKLDAEISKQNLLSILEQLEQKNIQLQLKREEIMMEKSLNKEEVKGSEITLDLEQNLLKKYKMLLEEGVFPEIEYLQQNNKVDQLKISIEKKILEGKKIESSLNQELKELESNISALISQKTAADVNLKYQSIKSPVDGIVFDLKPTDVGFVAQTSQPVMKIVPLKNLEANVLVPSDKIGFVRKDMQADISIDSFPASDFGVLEGSVSFIGSDALAPNQAEQISTYSFPVTIDLSDQYLNLRSGKNLPLQTGMSLTANIKLRKVSYLRLLLSNFKSKADSLKEI
jgi:HlyD family secretion protein